MCSPLQIIERLTEKTWGWGCVIFDEQKNKKLIFSSSHFLIYPARPSTSVDITLLDLQNSSYPTKAEFNNFL